MTSSAVSSLLAVVACFAVLLGIVARMLFVRRRGFTTPSLGVPAEDSSAFDMEKYRPMARLLEPEDLAFLQSQPGYRPEMGRQWKAERRRIFRLYLAELKSDFHSLHEQARRLVADADANAEALVVPLMRQRWIFLRTIWVLEFRLAMLSFGGGQVDAYPVLRLLESMRIDLQRHSLLQAV